MQVLMSIDEDAMVVPVGNANEDGNDGVSRGALGLAVEHEYCATVGLRGAAHGDGDGEPNNSAYGLVT
jgi:hypothetical protein